MRSLPGKLPPPPMLRGLSPELDRVLSAQAPVFAAISQLGLTQVFRVRTTGNPQAVDVGVTPVSWYTGRASNYCRVKEISTTGTVVTLQADTANVDLDLIVIF